MEDIDEVFLRVDSLVFAVLHECVDDGAAFTGLGMPDEEPVLQSQLGGADGLLGPVVVDVSLWVVEIANQRLPLSESILDRFGFAKGYSSGK